MNQVIIDLSSRNEYKPFKHMNAVNIPYDDLVNNYRSYLNKNTVYYLYCETGKLSRRASTILNYLGYHTNVLEK